MYYIPMQTTHKQRIDDMRRTKSMRIMNKALKIASQTNKTYEDYE